MQAQWQEMLEKSKGNAMYEFNLTSIPAGTNKIVIVESVSVQATTLITLQYDENISHGDVGNYTISNGDVYLCR